MGCWNGTDGITQLPIQYGDSIRLFLIANNLHSYAEDNIIYYSTDLWQPLGLPLKGTYDNYGSIENIEEDAFSDLLFQYVKENIINTPDRFGHCLDLANSSNNDILSRITEGNLSIKDPFTATECGSSLRNLEKEFPEVAKIIQTMKNDEPVKSVQVRSFLVHEDIYQGIATFPSKNPDKLLEAFKLDNVVYECRKLADKKQDANLPDQLHQYVKFVSCMSKTRKLWQPQAGEGSQSAEYLLYGLLSLEVNKLVGRKLKELDDQEI